MHYGVMSPLIPAPAIGMDWSSGRLSAPTHAGKKTVRDLAEYWQDSVAAEAMGETVVYETEMWVPDPAVVIDETPGVVLWGSTILHPGLVGEEFFMTRGHRHLNVTHGEMIFCVSGSGFLVLMDDDADTTRHELTAGTALWIDGRLAHRTVNTGDVPLIFWCAWPNDCGHDYKSTRQNPFSPVLRDQR
jgi:glucose-6-phosphate isomerase